MAFWKKLFGLESDPEPVKPQANEPSLGKTMHTLSPQLVVEPFSKINYWNLSNGGKRVRAYILMERPIEGAQTGVALDGSGSMMANFGQETIRQVRQLTDHEWKTLLQSGLARQRGNMVEIINLGEPRTLSTLVNFGVLKQTPPGPNIVEEQARQMTEYLTKFDADGGTTVIYWATGDGRQIEVLGDLTREQCSTARFPGPKVFGSETHLLPAIKYFVDRFADADWGMYVFISDGALNDLDAVKRYCIQLARDIQNKRRNPLKFVLIGVGNDIDEAQMEELDDLETGTDLDLWDHKIAKEMKQLADIFAEVVSETVIIVPGDGIVKDANENVVKDYRDNGLPALMWFDLPPGSQWFTLEIGGQVVAQPLAAGVQLPTMQPSAQSSPAASSPPSKCFECGESLTAGVKVCPHCGTSQDELTRKPSPPASKPAAGPPKLTVSPSSIDFGSVNRQSRKLPTQKVKLHKRGGSVWNGTVRSTLPWIEVNLTTVTCSSGDEVVLTVGLTQAAGRLRPRNYNATDALIIEGAGQKLQVGALVNIK